MKNNKMRKGIILFFTICMLTVSAFGASVVTGNAELVSKSGTSGVSGGLTHTQMITKIDAKYQLNAWLGAPVTGYVTLLQGMYRDYTNGSIYIGKEVGNAYFVKGEVRTKWREKGADTSYLMFPISDELTTSDGIGKYSNFEGGSVYWHPSTGAHDIIKLIQEKWSECGAEKGVFGYPITDSTYKSCPYFPYWYNDFQHGKITSVDYHVGLVEYADTALVKYSQQPYNNLSWATSASMIISHFKKDTTNRTVTIAQNKFGSTDFDKYASIQDAVNYIKTYTGITGTIRSGTVSYEEIKRQILKNAPLYINIDLKTGGSRALVVTGFETFRIPKYPGLINDVFVCDPVDGKTYRLDYDYLNNSNSTWTSYATFK